jgi:cholesterol oxidase
MSLEHFDAVVVGSGFGGSVMVYRLAEAGLRVCLLERGRAYPPGSFARTAHEFSKAFWDPSEQAYGLYNVWSWRGAGAVISAGLGGGSLIYANIHIRKDEKWFIHEDIHGGGFETWPVTRADLDPHYGVVEKMLNVQPYPFIDTTPKSVAWRDAAAAIPGVKLIHPNLAVSFRHRPYADDPSNATNPPGIGLPIWEPAKNIHEAARSTCRLCGECDLGCNYGSKNTLDYTYLSAATNLHDKPPDIRTLHEVRSFRRIDGGKFEITYAAHNPGQPSQASRQGTMSTDKLILAAGSLGSTFLMLKNRNALPGVSPLLGTRYSGNGDLLSFILRSRTASGDPRLLRPSYGPVITSAIRMGDALDGDGSTGRGFYIEDGGYPAALNFAVEAASFKNVIRRAAKFGLHTLQGFLGMTRDADLGAELAALVGDGLASETSVPFLAMGRDFPDGKLTYDGKYLDCTWKMDKSSAYYQRLDETGRRIAAALNADYMDNPTMQYFRQVLSAHPLGGCPMGLNEKEGVVNSYGEVFGEPNLYVADGSIVPGPVGPNPALTIAALADRAATHIIENRKGAPTS